MGRVPAFRMRPVCPAERKRDALYSADAQERRGTWWEACSASSGRLENPQTLPQLEGTKESETSSFDSVEDEKERQTLGFA